MIEVSLLEIIVEQNKVNTYIYIYTYKLCVFPHYSQACNSVLIRIVGEITDMTCTCNERRNEAGSRKRGCFIILVQRA